MTHALFCDGCGIPTTRADDSDGVWWELSASVVPGGLGMFPTITLEPAYDDVPDEEPPDEDEPQRHFCSVTCIAAWAERRPQENP